VETDITEYYDVFNAKNSTPQMLRYSKYSSEP